MTTYVALLRAVNVGGTGKLPMSDLKRICVELRFQRVETYIASGNVVFDSDRSAKQVHAQLAKGLRAYAGKEVGVFLRTAAEMQAIVKKNPFPDQMPNLVYAFFLDDKPQAAALAEVRGRGAEQLRLGAREIYVYYPNGMGQSKLRLPAVRTGTARNLNTVAKLVELATRT